MKMIELDTQQQAARDWFELLRDRICAEFEAIEHEAGSDARFCYSPWNRDDDPAGAGGGGVRGLMKGRIREGRRQRLDCRRRIRPRIRQDDPRRGRGSAFLCDRHQPRRPHVQPARPCGPHEYPLPGDDQALVRRRR
jgi:hypothetical protein